MVLFALSGFCGELVQGSPDESQSIAVRQLRSGAEGYGAMIGLVMLVAAVTAGTSRLTVHRTLKAME